MKGIFAQSNKVQPSVLRWTQHYVVLLEVIGNALEGGGTQAWAVVAHYYKALRALSKNRLHGVAELFAKGAPHLLALSMLKVGQATALCLLPGMLNKGLQQGVIAIAAGKPLVACLGLSAATKK